jgi:hypothetical protein
LEKTKLSQQELEEQYEGYCRLVDGLSELVADIDAGDGFYGNDPIEMLVDIRDRFDQINDTKNK